MKRTTIASALALLMVASVLSLLVSGFNTAHAAFPTNPAILDNFNRADGPLKDVQASSGYFWSNQAINSGSNGLENGGNQLIPSGGSNGYINHSFGPDTEFYADVPNAPSNGEYIAMFARIQNPGSSESDSAYALVYIQDSTNPAWALRRYDNGGFTQLGSSFTSTPIVGGNSIGMSVTGTGATVTVTVYLKNSSTWTTIGSAADTSADRITDPGYVGIEISNGATNIDNLSGGTVVVNQAPAAPSTGISSPANGATSTSITPTFQLKTTDADSDYLKYKIDVCADAACSSVVRTIDQTASQTGWSGQDQQTGTAYGGSSTLGGSTAASYAYQAPALSQGTQYWWRAYATDPGGTNTFSTASSIRSFTTLAPPNAPTSLGGAGYVNGSPGNDNTPTLSFNLSDPDSGDTVKCQIQVDDSSDFSSPIVNYTSALAAQGATSFTVGQAAGSGSYTNGASGQTLGDGSYYWRVKTLDTGGLASAFTTANTGAIAFKVDTANPTIQNLSPLDGATGVGLTDNLVIHFNEPVAIGSGGVTIKRTSDNATLQILNVAGARVTGGGTNTITVDPSVSFAASTAYYVQIDATGLDDLAGNSFAGISNTTDWNFTSASLSAPTLTSPADNSAFNLIDVDVTVAEPPLAGSVQLVFAGSSTITISLDDLSVGQHSFTLNPAALLSSPHVVSADASSIPDGVYDVAFSTRDATNSATLSDTSTHVTVDKAAPGVPGALSSASASTNTSPAWSWTSSSDATSGVIRYELQWSQDSGFVSGVLSGTSASTSYTTPTPLALGTWYFRARAVDYAGNASAYTSGTPFTVVAPPVVVTQPSAGGSSSSSHSRGTTANTSVAADQVAVAATDPNEVAGKIILNDYPEYNSGEGKQLELLAQQPVYFTVGAQEHSASVSELDDDSALLTIAADSQTQRIKVGETVRRDVSNDGVADIAITLVSVKDGKALMSFAQLTAKQATVPATATPSGSSNRMWIIIAGGVVLLIAGVTLYIRRRLRAAA